MHARHPQQKRTRRPADCAAFTLVEIMVVLALTLVMMAMFASIFQITGDFVTRQKGIGENDQSARILTTVLKTDLQGRTMRAVAPFHPNMPQLADDATNRLGYFYYSENNPLDDTDDVLQFTVSLNPSFLAPPNPLSGGELYGLATNLALPWQPGTNYSAGAIVRPSSPATATTGFVFKNKGGAFTSGASGNEPNWATAAAVGQTVTDNTGTWTALLSPIDQPDGDDAGIAYDALGNRTLTPPNSAPNNTGASQYAEVSYFLRNGNLYRRVLLIRQPYDLSGNTSAQPYDTDTPTPALMIPAVTAPTPPYPPYALGTGTGNFQSDFDFSARMMPVNPAGGPTGVSFLGVGGTENSLDNTGNAYADPYGTGLIPIGRPDNRFGFDQTYINDGVTITARNGAPREYALQFGSSANTILNTGTPIFFGRYTQEETSNSNFKFPGDLTPIPPLSATKMSPVGWSSILGLDSVSSTMWLLNANPPTGNQAAFNGGPRRGEDILLTNVVSFDVKIWDNLYSETAVNQDLNRNGIIDAGPAFADVGHGAAGSFQASANVFQNFGPGPNITGSTTYTNNNVFDTWYRYFNFDNVQRTYDTADTNILYAPAPYRPRIGTTWAASTPYAVGALVDPTVTANGYVYKCITAGTSGTTAPFSLTDRTTAPVTTVTDGTTGLTWQPQPPLAVQAIQITVKYLDPAKNLLRQVTIVQSLAP